jgi:membrane fusion protein (multidrug efflux system)
VVGFAAGTGAAFALLPAQNATGNWIKVVQRLPVRIALDPKELAAHPLQIGLSLDVEVDVHEKGGAALARAHEDPAPAYSTNVYANQERDLDALIAKIIAENDASPARLAQSSAGRARAPQNNSPSAARVALNAPVSHAPSPRPAQ